MNGVGSAEGMAESECREWDDAGVIVLVGRVVTTLAEWVEEWVLLPLLLEIGLKCMVSDQQRENRWRWKAH